MRDTVPTRRQHPVTRHGSRLDARIDRARPPRHRARWSSSTSSPAACSTTRASRTAPRRTSREWIAAINQQRRSKLARLPDGFGLADGGLSMMEERPRRAAPASSCWLGTPTRTSEAPGQARWPTDRQAEPIGCAWGPTRPLAVLSRYAAPGCYSTTSSSDFAQVTNPPMDPIREGSVMSLSHVPRRTVPRTDVLHTVARRRPRQIESARTRVDRPSTTPVLERPRARGPRQPTSFERAHSTTAPTTVAGASDGLPAPLDRLVDDKPSAADPSRGARLLVLTDRDFAPERFPALRSRLSSPSAAVHHAPHPRPRRVPVSRPRSSSPRRRQCWSTHHLACARRLRRRAQYMPIPRSSRRWRPSRSRKSNEERSAGGRGAGGSEQHWRAALSRRACIKILSRRWASPSSWRRTTGAQIFEAIGLGDEVIDKLALHRHGEPDRRRGARRSRGDGGPVRRRRAGHGSPSRATVEHIPTRGRRRLPVPAAGREPPVQSRGRLRSSSTAVREDDADQRDAIASTPITVDDRDERRSARCVDLLEAFADETSPRSRIEEVEPVERSCVKRFRNRRRCRFGSISAEAHETLAIAMNRIGGRVQHRRGRRGPVRNAPSRTKDARTAWGHRRASIEGDQAGRVGPVRSDERLPRRTPMSIQIKIAQGAKPGEGGQLRGNKVDS